VDSTATLTLPNADNAASALALSDLLRDTPVTIYAYHAVAGEINVDYSVTGSLGEGATFVQALAGFVADHEGILRYRLADEPRFEGLRRVENLLTGTSFNSHDLTTWSVAQAQVIDSQTVRFPAGIDSQIYVQTIGPRNLAGRTLRISYDVASSDTTQLTIIVRRSGNTNFSPVADYTQSYITDSVQRFTSLFSYPAADLNQGLRLAFRRINPATDVVATITNLLIEDVTDQTNQNPSEYVSHAAVAFPYHGANVDGVKYFSTENGNTVNANGIVTEGTGAAITGGSLRMEPEATNIILNSNNNTAAGGWTPYNNTPTFNQVGIFGLANTATLVTDSSSSLYAYVQRDTSVSFSLNDIFTVRAFVKKASSAPGYNLLVRTKLLNTGANDWVDLQVDYYTGQKRVATTGTGLTAGGSSVEEYGDWWVLSIECRVANAAGNGTRIEFFPAVGTTMTTYTSNATGSGVIGNIEQYALPIEQVQTLPPIITTTTAVTRSADSLTYGTVAANNRTRAVVDGVTLDIDDWSGTMDSAVLGADLAGEISSLSTYGAYAEQLSSLLIDSVDDISLDKVGFSLSTVSQSASHLPDILLGPPICNHIPPPGSKITWLGTVYVLED
jgi:hypothetical protein